MLLLVNHGIYYEFLPYHENDAELSDALSLGDVELGGEYALVISTNAGLWRYLVGDCRRFDVFEHFAVFVALVVV